MSEFYFSFFNFFLLLSFSFLFSSDAFIEVGIWKGGKNKQRFEKKNEGGG